MNSSPSLQSNKGMPSFNPRTGLAWVIHTILTVVILGGWTYGCHWMFGILVTFLTFGGVKALIGISSLGILMGAWIDDSLSLVICMEKSFQPPTSLIGPAAGRSSSTTPWTNACTCQTFQDMSQPKLRKLSF
jgi:hypothetical protein